MSMYIEKFSKDWSIWGDGSSVTGKFNLYGYPFNLDLSEIPKYDVEMYIVSKTFGQGDVFLSEFVPSTSDDRILIANHGLQDGMIIHFKLGVPANRLPAPLIVDQDYFLVNTRINDFKVSATSGGLPVDITSMGTGTNDVWIPEGHTGETLTQIGCTRDGAIVSFTMPLPAMAVGVNSVVRLRAKIYI